MLPPSVNAPVGVTIALTVISNDRAAHRVALGGTVLSIPAKGHASAKIKGLSKGSHTLLFDGKPGPTLVVGAKVGP